MVRWRSRPPAVVRRVRAHEWPHGRAVMAGKHMAPSLRMLENRGKSKWFHESYDGKWRHGEAYGRENPAPPLPDVRGV